MPKAFSDADLAAHSLLIVPYSLSCPRRIVHQPGIHLECRIGLHESRIIVITEFCANSGHLVKQTPIAWLCPWQRSICRGLPAFLEGGANGWEYPPTLLGRIVAVGYTACCRRTTPPRPLRPSTDIVRERQNASLPSTPTRVMTLWRLMAGVTLLRQRIGARKDVTHGAAPSRQVQLQQRVQTSSTAIASPSRRTGGVYRQWA